MVVRGLSQLAWGYTYARLVGWRRARRRRNFLTVFCTANTAPTAFCVVPAVREQCWQGAGAQHIWISCLTGNYCMLLALACEHVHAVHAYTTGIHILGCSIPHTLIIPSRSRAGYGVCKRVCTRVWCTSTHEAIYSFVLVFYMSVHFTVPYPGPPGYMESIPLGGGYRVHTLIPGYIPGYGTSKYIYMKLLWRRRNII